MKRAFVTGATGFIGSHVARLLVERGWSVRALKRPGALPLRLDPLDVEWVEGDLRDAGQVYRSMRGSEVVFHIAADYRLWAKNPNEIYESNVTGTENVLGAALALGVERVVHTSSVGALGLCNDGTPANERTPVSLSDMVGHYKRSKFLAERKAEEFMARGLEVVVVNPSTPVGPGDHKPTPTGRIIVDFLNRRLPAYLDTGLNLIHVGDVAKGHLLAFERGRPGEKYILGNRNMSLRDILGILSSLAHIPAPKVRLPYAPVLWLAHIAQALSRLSGAPPLIPLEGVRMARKLMFFSPEKAVQELGLPQTPVEDALLEAVSWFRAHGYAP